MADHQKAQDYRRSHHKTVNPLQNQTEVGSLDLLNHEDKDSIWTMSKHLGNVAIPIIIG